MTPFQPLPGLAGGHRQTLAGHLARFRLQWHHPTEDVIIEAPDEVRILLRVSWQTGSRAERPAVLLVHGLEGTDRSAYILSAGELAYRQRFHVVRMNMRGCGDALQVCPRLYNAGVSTDLLAALNWLSSRARTIAICGFSLGANLALLTLTRHREATPEAIRTLVAINPPLDLAAAADSIARLRNFVYQSYFLSKLKRSYRRRQRLLPERYIRGLERGRRSIREYDDAIIAPYGGYRGADDYYARASAGPHLSLLDRRTLILASDDDPMIPPESITRWALAPQVCLEMLPTGGHVGFVGKTTAPGRFWAAERALAFIGERL